MDRVVPAVNHEQEKEKKPETDVVSPERVSYPRIDPEDLVPPPPLMTTTADVHTASAQKSVSWSEVLIQEPPPRTISETTTTTLPNESNPYVAVAAPAPTGSSKVTMDKLKSMLGRWGKKVGEAAKKTEDLAGNTWQHLRTGPSFADAAMGRITQTTKVIAEGGYDKIFRSTFDVLPEEQLKKTFACYLSTSAGPVMGMLYLSSAKLAFCSDAPLSYSVVDKTEWSYYKVIIPSHQLRTASPSSSKLKPAEKYIQVVSIDNHEFWFLGFVNYDSAVKSLQEACLGQNLQT